MVQQNVGAIAIAWYLVSVFVSMMVGITCISLAMGAQSIIQ